MFKFYTSLSGFELGSEEVKDSWFSGKFLKWPIFGYVGIWNLYSFSLGLHLNKTIHTRFTMSIYSRHSQEYMTFGVWNLAFSMITYTIDTIRFCINFTIYNIFFSTRSFVQLTLEYYASYLKMFLCIIFENNAGGTFCYEAFLFLLLF